jgi:hypothetical protein
MLPLYNVFDYIQAIAPDFIERFCHCTVTNFCADLRIVAFKSLQGTGF